MAETILREKVEALLIAGDVFDTTTPSHLAQELYYRFLCRVAASPCRHVVVIGGNHDSPSFLNAPKEVLRVLNVHVVGSAAEHRDAEVLLLQNAEGVPELIVCAVPYLRDRDIRSVEAGESAGDKERKLIEGIGRHYSEVTGLAEKKRSESGAEIPIVAMGHLFTLGGQTVEDDGVRELYIGSLAHVSAKIFADCIDYVALGHLHVSQKVNGSETMRHSGSPLPMGFGEARRTKSVCLVEFAGRKATVELIPVPIFQQLQCVRGDWDNISGRLRELSEAHSRAWLEIVYEGDEVIGDLRERLDAAIDGTQMEILRVKNNRIMDRVLNRVRDEETLDDLSVDEVFARCLAVHDVPEEQRPELIRTYREAVASLHEEDGHAE